MLSADQIETLGNKAQKLLDPVQEFLIREIAARIAEAGSMTATAQYQVWRLQNLGISQRQLKKELRRLLKISHRDLRKLLEDAGEEGYTYDIRQLPQVQAIPFRESRVMQDIVYAAVSQARENLTNITQSLGFCLDAEGKVCLPLSEAYEQACDTAFMRVSTGAQDFQSAVREATQGLARKGIQYIDYESGVHTSIEAATRRSVMGGMGLMQEKISQGVHDECGCDGWEISAHACSAPDHEPIQGKQYSDAEYQKLNNSLRRRIGTLNCGHAAHPIILGISRPQYSEKELEKLRQDNQKGVEIDGKHYTMYEATQKQRAIERAMRAQKKKILAAEATGDPDLPQLQSRMQVLSQEYSRFSQAAGLRTQVERTRVAGKHKKAPSAEFQNYHRPNRGPETQRTSFIPKGIEVSAVKVDGYRDVYVSDLAEVKPKEIHDIHKNTADAIRSLGIQKERQPQIVIVSDEELPNAYARYDACNNTVYYAHKINRDGGIPEAGGFGAVEYHEMCHMRQAEEFIRRNGPITNENYGEYLSETRKICKRRLDRIGINEYNVGKISDYARQMYSPSAARYDEVEAEYRVFLWKGGKLD